MSNQLHKIRVLVVDDSAVMRKIITHAIEKEPAIEVIGHAATGLKAIEAVNTLKPDVVTLDIEMPEMDGLTALREIRKAHKRLPIIMFSSLTQRGAQAAVMALTAGASDYVGKPATSAGSIEEAFKVLEAELVPKIVGLAKRMRMLREQEKSSPAQENTEEIVTSPPTTITRPSSPPPPRNSASQANFSGGTKIPVKQVRAICIAVSTGGPVALMQLFSQFNHSLPVPVFIVQHMPSTFTALLASRLSATSLLTVKEPEDGEVAEPGMVYIAPGGFHMVLSHSGTKTLIRLNTEPPENSCRPAADVLFRSAADVYGSGLLAVVLTGMGSDGMKGCRVIKEKTGQVIAQDEESSVIWGMPGAVVKDGSADMVLPLDKIADEILFRTRKSATGR